MRIVNRTTGREVTVEQAVHAVVGGDHSPLLQALMVRLLEELANSGTLRATQIARVLEYAFQVEED